MEISKVLQKFLQDPENQKLLNNYEFEKLYKKLNASKLVETSDISTFSALMYNIGINPLLYLTDIPARFLCNQPEVTSIKIPKNIKSICNCAFYDCSGLTSITIPDSVTSIGVSAFHLCSGLTSVTIGNSVTSIGPYVFEGCSRLTDIIIPSSITYIGNYIFNYCKKLVAINFNGTEEQWINIDKEPTWNNNSSIIIVHCTDGDIQL